MSDERYNGWANYPTWCVNLWLTNDEPLYRYWARVAQETWDAAAPTAYATREQVARGDLVNRLETEVSAMCPDLVGFPADLLSWALGSVDWWEIAEAWLNDVDKTEGDTDDDQG